MKLSSTWLFAGVVALVSAYVIYDFRMSQEDLDSGEVRLFDLKIEQVEQVSLEGPEGKIVLKKVTSTPSERWQLLEPLQDDVEEMAIQSLLLTLLGQNGRTFSDSGKKNWAEFGLAPSKMKITIVGSGKTEVLEISSTNAFDGSFYLRSQDQLLLGDKMWARVIEQKPNMLRDHKLFPSAAKDVTEVKVTSNSAPQYSLRKVEGGWQIVPDPGFPIDSLKVDHWLDDIQGLRANGFASEQLNGPSLNLEIHFGDKKQWDLKISPDHGDLVYAKTNLKPIIYTVGTGVLRTIRVLPPFFRDGKVPFQFALELADLIDFYIPPFRLKFQKAEPDWILAGEDHAKDSLNHPRLIEFMQKLRSLEAVDFPKTATGFKQPSQGLRVSGKSGQTLLEFEIGDEYKASEGLNKGATLNYVRVTGQKQILGVKSQELKDLMAPDILKNVNVESKAESKTELNENH